MIGVVDLLLSATRLCVSVFLGSCDTALLDPYAEQGSVLVSCLLACMLGAGVIGVVDLLLSATPLTQEQESYLHTIRTSGESLLAVLSTFLDSCHMEAIRLATHGSAFSLHETVHRASSLMAPLGQDMGVQIMTSVQDGVPDIVEGDSHGLFHILSCLLSFALQRSQS